MHSLFVYGTLKKSATQRSVFKRTIQGVPATAVGYKRFPVYINGKRYSCIRPAQGTVVRGLVLLVTTKELQAADRYEERDVYARRSVALRNGTRAFAYVSRTT